MSPGRKVSIRMELIDQLEKWNQLHTSGVIDENEYQELRKTINRHQRSVTVAQKEFIVLKNNFDKT